MSGQKSLAACTLIPYICVVILTISGATIKIRPQACTNAVGDSGTCMFVWQCIKQEGVQLGPCVDRFLVGTCCRLPDESDNLVPGASGVDPTPLNKVKPPSSIPVTTPRSTTSVPPVPTAAVMTSPPLTIGTSRPGVVEAVRPTFRPIVPAVVGRSAGGHVHAPVNSSATPIAENDYSECGITTPQPKGKVVGGTHSTFGEWPWQVSVRRSSFFGFASTHRCGGAILNANWVATAGHCVDE